MEDLLRRKVNRIRPVEEEERQEQDVEDETIEEKDWQDMKECLADLNEKEESEAEDDSHNIPGPEVNVRSQLEWEESSISSDEDETTEETKNGVNLTNLEVEEK